DWRSYPKNTWKLGHVLSSKYFGTASSEEWTSLRSISSRCLTHHRM
ncbi:hypothetical protein AVEN_251801-2-1, partial [Araneus ventricosus]